MRMRTIPVWKESPCIRLLMAFIAGVLLQTYPGLSSVLSGYLFIIGFSFYSIIACLPIQFRFRYRYLQSSVLLLMVTLAAAILTLQQDIRIKQNWFGHHLKNKDAIEVILQEPLSEKQKSYKVMAGAVAVLSDKKRLLVTGKILVYLPKDSSVAKLRYGDRLLLTADPLEIPAAGNPGAFDYRRYLGYQQVYRQVFVKPGQWQNIGEPEVQASRQFIFQLREQVLKILRRYVSDGPEITGIAEALLIGYKDDLDQDLIQDYSKTGVIHIIAISGLHLGLIYAVMNYLLGLIPFLNRRKLLHALLVISALWIFSLLSGASASVLRSAVMLTCIISGKAIQRSMPVYNALAASAVLLLCYQPFFLWDVGFQLSYLAVIGIVWLQKPLQRLLYIPQKQIRSIWEMFCVTLAAQVFTTPVCLYYFHQFPNFFFISNLLAVPLSTLILFSELLLLIVAWLTPVAIIVGKIVGWGIELMNTIISFISKLPYAYSDNIVTTFTGTLLWYVLIFSVLITIQNKKRNWKLFSGMMLYVCVFHGVVINIMARKQQRMIVYQSPKHMAVDFISGKNYCFLGDLELNRNERLRNYVLRPTRIFFNATNAVSSVDAFKPEKVIYGFCGKRLVIISDEINFEALSEKIVVDVLLITGNPKVNINDLAQVFQPQMIVMDASNSMWKIAKWQKACDMLLLPHYSVPEKGAFIFNIR